MILQNNLCLFQGILFKDPFLLFFFFNFTIKKRSTQVLAFSFPVIRFFFFINSNERDSYFYEFLL